MMLTQQRLAEANTNNNVSGPNTNSTDELAGFSPLLRGAMEVMIIKTIERVVVPMLMPLIRQVIEEQIGLAKQEIMASMKENLANKASTSDPKKLKLQFRNKVSLPIYTGKPLLGEKETAIEIVLVDALTGQIVNTGPESMAKLEIVGFRVGDDDNNDDSWTFENFQEKIISEKKGNGTLKGNTRLQLKEGVCFIENIHFTHTAENTKNGFYRLGAGVVDAALMNRVEIARTEAFLMKDGRVSYSEKHSHPLLSDKVCHLQKIRYKGNRYKRLEMAKVDTVKDFLTLLYTDPKRLEDILELKASSKVLKDIVGSAQASNGMFLYLDPNEPKAGIVLNAKLELKALIEDSRYIPVNQLSDKQKVDSQDLVRFAIKHLQTLEDFKDETCIKKRLLSGTDFTSVPSAKQSLGAYNITDGPPGPSSHVPYLSPGLIEAPNNLKYSNFHMGQTMNHEPIVTSQTEGGKHNVPFDDEMIYSTEYYHEHISSHLATPSGHSFRNATEPGASYQAAGPLNTFGLMKPHDIFSQDQEEFEEWQHDKNPYYDILRECLNNEWQSEPVNSDAGVVMMATQTVSVTIAGIRWRKVSKLLRRNSVRERISSSEGIQAHKKRRCC